PVFLGHVRNSGGNQPDKAAHHLSRITPDQIDGGGCVEFVILHLIVGQVGERPFLDEDAVSKTRLGGERVAKEVSGLKGKAFDHWPRLRWTSRRISACSLKARYSSGDG